MYAYMYVIYIHIKTVAKEEVVAKYVYACMHACMCACTYVCNTCIYRIETVANEDVVAGG